MKLFALIAREGEEEEEEEIEVWMTIKQNLSLSILPNLLGVQAYVPYRCSVQGVKPPVHHGYRLKISGPWRPTSCFSNVDRWQSVYQNLLNSVE